MRSTTTSIWLFQVQTRKPTFHAPRWGAARALPLPDYCQPGRGVLGLPRASGGVSQSHDRPGLLAWPCLARMGLSRDRRREGDARACQSVGPMAGGVWVLPGGLGTGRFQNLGPRLNSRLYRLFLVFPIAKGRPIGQIYHHRRAAPRCAARHSSSRCPRRPHSGRGQAAVMSSYFRPWLAQ